MKSCDGARAILEGLAAPDDPIDDHENIVGRVALADDCAAASVADRPAPYRKNGVLRAFLAALNSTCRWKTCPSSRHDLVSEAVLSTQPRQTGSIRRVHLNCLEIQGRLARFARREKIRPPPAMSESGPWPNRLRLRPR